MPAAPTPMSTERQRRAIVAARLDGDAHGFDRGFRRGARAGLWLGALSGAAAAAVLLQLFHVLREWGGIVPFLAVFFS